MSKNPMLYFLLLSEDSSSQSVSVLQHLVDRILSLIEPRASGVRKQFDPLPDNEKDAQQGRDLDLILSWEQDPALLDECSRLKDSCSLGSKYNLELASTSFPSRKLDGVGKSYARVVQSVRGASPILNDL